jgi:hypothetical protein
MQKPSPCVCDGMNEECSICGGSGYVNSPKVDIHRTVPSDSQLRKEERELNAYLHPHQEPNEKLNKIRSTPAKAKRPKKSKKNNEKKTLKQKLRSLKKKLRKLDRKQKQETKREQRINPKKLLADARIFAKGKKKT